MLHYCYYATIKKFYFILSKLNKKNYGMLKIASKVDVILASMACMVFIADAISFI
jgi:hypothetical protein